MVCDGWDRFFPDQGFSSCFSSVLVKSLCFNIKKRCGFKFWFFLISLITHSLMSACYVQDTVTLRIEEVSRSKICSHIAYILMWGDRQ